MELGEILRMHSLKYPCMKPVDGVKLIYQNEFGGGHMIKNADDSLRRLENEYAATLQRAGDLWEEIGGGFVRVQLSAMECHGLSVAELNRLFVESSRHRGERGRFLAKLDMLRAMCEEGVFAFSATELEEYLDSYIEAGCPAVSHSESYRTAYAPAYRVIRKELLD